MNPKSIYATITAIILSIVMAAIPTLQTLAEDSQVSTEYISEIKIGVGETVDEAVASLDGYTILKNGNDYADLNGGAGGGLGSKGDRVVLLGYKITKSRTDAITDIAVMNMKGGYSVKDYELLMQQQMTEQIIPFVDGFLAAIKEYRENYNSENTENKAKATAIHDALNKLTDDDCADAGLGDLLLNETKYEMGDAAYDALPEEEKNRHADILTIIAQANGQATLVMEILLTMAADTGEETWIDRFVSTTYDDLLAMYPDMLPSDAEAELARIYDDDARKILSLWDILKEKLDEVEESSELYDELLEKDLTEQTETIHAFDLDSADEAQMQAFSEAAVDVDVHAELITSLFTDISIKESLSAIEYGDGTLLDFFMMDYDKVEENITLLYPLVASLSAGQRAGLEFITITDLIMMAVTDSEGYKDASFDDMAEVSIYENVDREIYKKGGVALTSEALRARSAEEVAAQGGKISILTYILYGVTAASAVAFGVSLINKLRTNPTIWVKDREALDKINAYGPELRKLELAREQARLNVIKAVRGTEEFDTLKIKYENANKSFEDKLYEAGKAKKEYKDIQKVNPKSVLCSKLMIGFGIAMVVLSAISLYMTYRDLVGYYKVDYTPIPHYIVDEKDITAYNAKGEKIVIKNQAAYYKAVECNRAGDDEWYDTLGSSADLNGTVGRQWLALYTAKNENMSPIIADSLKVVVGSTDVPTDYDTGIHMFGSGSAYNLNNTQLVWNNDAKSIFVYFNTEDEKAAEEPADPDPKDKESETETETETEKETDPAKEETKAPETKEAEKETEQPAVETTAVDPATETSTEGSGFSGGALALSGGIGILVGALGAYAIVMAMKKKEE